MKWQNLQFHISLHFWNNRLFIMVSKHEVLSSNPISILFLPPIKNFPRIETQLIRQFRPTHEGGVSMSDKQF